MLSSVLLRKALLLRQTSLFTRGLHSSLFRFSSTVSSISEALFPYQCSEFEQLRKNKLFFVDKTQYLHEVDEAGAHCLFLRPPRWGKTFLLNTMHCYYDFKKKDKFNELFGDLEIGKTPTSHRNSYFVLKLDFSLDLTGDVEKLRQRFFDRINNQVRAFRDYYNLDFDILPDDAFTSLQELNSAVALNKIGPDELFILIDEYDHHSNKLLLEQRELYDQLIAGRIVDPPTSLVCSVYETIKGMSATRSFSTGVNPINMAYAAGANFIMNISLDDPFGGVIGFTEDDVSMALERLGVPTEEKKKLLELMKIFYNGFLFPGASEPLYNPSQVLHFFALYARDSSFRDFINRPNLENLDRKTIIDKLQENDKPPSKTILQLFSKAPGVSDLFSELLHKEIDFEAIVDSFQLHKLFSLSGGELPLSKGTDNQDLALSLLYYQGFVTWTKSFESIHLPNKLIKCLYLEELNQLINLKKDDIITVLDNPNEKNIKALLWSIISKQKIIHDDSFSEQALQAEIETVLHEIQREDPSAFKLFVDEASQPEQVGVSKRPNLLLQRGETLVLLEFKRLPPNSLITYIETIYDILGFYNGLEKHSEAHLRSLPIISSTLNSKAKSVKKFEEETKKQISKTIPLLQKHFGSCTLKVFSVVQVGWPLLVKEIPVPKSKKGDTSPLDLS